MTFWFAVELFYTGMFLWMIASLSSDSGTGMLFGIAVVVIATAIEIGKWWPIAFLIPAIIAVVIAWYNYREPRSYQVDEHY